MHISFLHKNAGNLLKILPLWNHDLLSKLGKRTREYKVLQFLEDYCSFRSCPGIVLGYPFDRNQSALWWPFPDLKGSHILLDFWMWIDTLLSWGLPGGSSSKASACNAGDLVGSLGQEDLLEKEMATHSSTLAWTIPWMEEPGRLQSMGLQRVGHDWVTPLSLSLYGNYCKGTLLLYFGNFSRKYKLAHSRYTMRKGINIQIIRIPTLTSSKIIKYRENSCVHPPPPFPSPSLSLSIRTFMARELFSTCFLIPANPHQRWFFEWET